MFKSERFEAVLAHTQIADQLGMVLGPLLAALALQWMDWSWVVVVTAVLFVMADAALAMWRRGSTVQFITPQDAGRTGPAADLMQGGGFSVHGCNTRRALARIRGHSMLDKHSAGKPRKLGQSRP